MVIAEMGSGGAEAIAEALARRLVADGDQVAVASAGGRRLDDLTDIGVRTIDVPMRDRTSAKTVLAARGLLPARRSAPDVIHAHNVRASVAAHLGVRWPRHTPPLVTTVHGLVPEDYPAAAKLLRRTSDVVVAVSDAVAAQLRDAGYDGTVEVVENAANAVVPGPRADVRAELGISPKARVVLCAARLAPPKRLDLLVDAWPSLPKNAVLVVAGDGPLLEPLRARVSALNLGDRVRLLGERTDVGRLLGGADVFCLPSDSEGMPVAVLEAMAAGVPVVASAVGGIEHGTDGAARLVLPGSSGALASELASLLDDPAARAALAERGRAVVAARYSPDAMYSRYRALYASLAGR
jgi:glycosyltransferase involved in cell wall biosynthesis